MKKYWNTIDKIYVNNPLDLESATSSKHLI